MKKIKFIIFTLLISANFSVFATEDSPSKTTSEGGVACECSNQCKVPANANDTNQKKQSSGATKV